MNKNSIFRMVSVNKWESTHSSLYKNYGSKKVITSAF